MNVIKIVSTEIQLYSQETSNIQLLKGWGDSGILLLLLDKIIHIQIVHRTILYTLYRSVIIIILTMLCSSALSSSNKI